MKALVKTEKGKGFVEIREVEEPKPGDNEVLINIKAAGICGSDLHFYDGTLTSCIPPVILGHEFSGEIVDIGRNVAGYKIGDRVVSEAHKGGCGRCRFCMTGKVEICKGKKAVGYKIDGCFAPYLALPESSLHKMPDELTFEQAAVTEPLAIVVKGVLERARVEVGDFVVILGSGPIGLLAGAAAKAAGARYAIVAGTGRDEKVRLKVARQLNIDHALNIENVDLTSKVMELTGGVGADLVVEACGAESAIQQAFEIVRVEGRICALGHTGRENLTMPWEMGLRKSVQLSWSFSSSWLSWEKSLSFLSTGRVKGDALISHIFPLADWKKAFDLLENMDAVKILLIP